MSADKKQKQIVNKAIREFNYKYSKKIEKDIDKYYKGKQKKN